MNIFNSLFGKREKNKEKIVKLKKDIINKKKEDIKDLKKLNRAFKLLLDKGSVEITIRNVDGVLKEFK